ncbi:tumor necrosis factor receptor superfamily member 1B isoform X1 [Fukomys damarensis]|uniref:tumor necrosis factor receptor superfamily member 1B isoform X1 n=1 Tax=Fukomys damarensis TaxID=885580 RepID=UPI0014552470|nr:tumor necrosis factor receptor superfamily member 1B isoform X1 [Fukomys damarensis]
MTHAWLSCSDGIRSPTPCSSQPPGAPAAPRGGPPSPQAVFMPYAPEFGTKCQVKEYYETTSGMCCSLCQPGQHMKALCTKTSDTVCAPCEDNTYTQLWNWLYTCLSCRSPCSSDQVEIQACTPQQNRICTCRPGQFCILGSPDSCRQCIPLRKCPPGFGMVKPGTASSDVHCAACVPGTFSNTLSSTEVCRPHRQCSSVAVPGNATTDAVCTSVSSTLEAAPGPARTPRSVSQSAESVEPTLAPSTAASTVFPLPEGPEPPTGKSKNGISLPIGLIVGLTALGLLVIGLVNCAIVTQKKKKSSCTNREAKVLHLPVDKFRGVKVLEQQQLLTTAPSSSSNSLESSAGTAAPGAEKAEGSGETPASSRSSESPPGGHGTQVNVTCIVNVCSGSDHGSQCSSQAATEDPDTSPAGPPEEEQVPFSQEERPFQSWQETPETLLQSLEKPLPFCVLESGVRLSNGAGVSHVAAAGH